MKDMMSYCGLKLTKMMTAYIATINNDQTLREKLQNYGQS